MTNTAKLELILDVTFQGSRNEVVLVPADATNREIHSLIDHRFQVLDGSDFETDHTQFERWNAHSEWADKSAQHSLEYVRGANGNLVLVKDEVGVTQPVESADERRAEGLVDGLVFVEVPEDLHTIIAALRYWQAQGMCDPSQRSDEMHSLCTNDDELTSYADSDVDDLVERLNVDMKAKAFMEDLKAII
jgi:hypothetical protein